MHQAQRQRGAHIAPTLLPFKVSRSAAGVRRERGVKGNEMGGKENRRGREGGGEWAKVDRVVSRKFPEIFY